MADVIKVKFESDHPTLNKAKWVALFIVFFVALFVNYHFAAISTPIRLIAWLIIAVALFGIFCWTSQGKRFLNFAKAARNEMRKVVWPTRQETMQSTIAVIVLVGVLALILWVIDSLWLWLITLITG
ncbi:MAG: secE [Gammaproteobacteria bacterium]|jgi:preprotein translocase subunit SecE|nr:secE [Gammaproteobacteria bacterium]